jgi:hypothetical protein
MGIVDCMTNSNDEVEKTLLEMRLGVESILKKCKGIPNVEEESEINGILNSAMNVGLTIAKESMVGGDMNALNIMRSAGAKGSLVNLTQIVSFVGQQNIGGQRIPASLSGKSRTLPHFIENDHSAEARGFVSNGYLKGLNPSESFFHAAAGRTGIISTSIKSVTYDTTIFIIENEIPKTVKIGEWIDEHILEADENKIEHYEEMEMEYLTLSNTIYIPTVDCNGKVTWGLVSAATRHLPTENLYNIITELGRKVTVAESKSLIVFNHESAKLEHKHLIDITVNDYLPVTQLLPQFHLEIVDFNIPPHNIENPGGLKKFLCDRSHGYFLGALISSCLFLKDNVFLLRPKNTYTPNMYDEIFHVLDRLKVKGHLSEDGQLYIKSTILSKFIYKMSKNLNEIILTCLEFKEGILDGYFSFCGICDYDSKSLICEEDVQDCIPEYSIINMICNSFGIVTRIYNPRKFHIEGIFLAIMKNTISITNDLLQEKINECTLMYEDGECSDFFGNICLDKIKSIEKIKSGGEKLYDLTIPSTLNFCIANGLHVADTSDTGYIQKKIGRKIEDCKAYIDGTVRIGNGRIIQFLYGDDGMNPKFLYVPKGLDFPFFVNPINISRRLNSDAVQKNMIGKKDKPRKLNEMEINLLLSFINAGVPYLKSDVIENSTNVTRIILRKLLEDEELVIYNCMIPTFCSEIKNMYESAKIHYGEMVGLHTASFIGEPTTQMMLDSVTYETEILVRNKKGFVTKYMIGEFVENHIVKSERVERYDDKDMTWAALDEEKEYYEIMSATEDGRTEWCRIEGVSKHPVINKDGSNIMLKVTTEYCKEVTATKAKSFLQLVDGKIQEVDGDKLKVGDYIPVSFKKIDYTKVFELDLKEICPPNEYLYTSELAKAKEVMHEHKWWMKHSGKTFILPHSRSDTVVELLRETPRKGVNVKASLNLKENCVYMKNINNCNYQIPEKIPLDYNFGYLVGAYCAEGCMTKHQLSIANNDEEYFGPIKELCERWNITTKYYVHKNKGKEGWTSSDLRIYNTFLCRVLEKLCGKLSHNKFVDQRIVFSNYECQIGFLDAYIGGDGYVKSNSILISSTSLKMLTDVCVMLRSMNIYSFVKKTSPYTKDKVFPTYITKLENLHQIYHLHIRNEQCKHLSNILNLRIAHKRKALGLIHKKDYDYEEDYIYNIVNGVTKEQRRKKRCPDLKFEKIISIEEVPNTTNYAYDLTTTTTRNFDLYSGPAIRDTFHNTGVKGKDVSIGVPRFNELLNATKSNKQKKISQTIYFDIPKLNENKEFLKGKSENEETKKVKLENLCILEKLRKKFEETSVGTFVKHFEMQYLSPDVDPDINMSPIKILTYEEYEKKWWVELKEEFFGEPKFKPEHWVVVLYFDVEKLYMKEIELEDIAIAIEEDSDDKYYCCASPSAIGIIEVYCNFSIIKDYVKNKIELPPLSPEEENSEKTLITDDNLNYFICRDVIIGYLCNIKLSGIFGIKRVYPREVVETGEWVLDADCREIQTKVSNNRFLESLTTEGVNPYSTVIDDMHTIQSTLGIEATRKFLIEELTRIISFDGVYINPRHIQLLVDSMTYTGEITSVRRDGISRDVGPNAKIMFEQAVDNAVEASAFSEFDDMSGVSSSIMYGLTSKAGTGMVEVKPIDQLPMNPIKIQKDIDVLNLKEVNEDKESMTEKRKRFTNAPGTKRKSIIRKK